MTVYTTLIDDFEWDDANERHIARHGVTTEEAEEALLGALFVRRVRWARYGAFGRTLEGRFLFVVFETVENRIARVITARDMSPRERRFLRRWRG